MKKIKITQINPTDLRGGASLAGYRLHKEFLKEPEIDSVLFVNKKYSQDREVVEFSNPVFRLIEKVLNKFGYFTGLQYVFSVNWLGLLFYQRFWQTDVFIVRMLHGGYLPLWLPWFLSLIGPVVWRMPDMWAFTGRCVFSEKCPKKEYPAVFFDLSPLLLRLKKFFYKNSKIHIVCPSRWLFKKAKESGIFKNENVFYIPTGVDAEIFKPGEKNQKLSLIAVSVDLKDKRKGGEIFPIILEKLNEELRKKNIFIDFYRVGNRHIEISRYRNIEYSHINNIFLGYLDEKQLAEYYAKSHFYLLPTLADNLPNTLLESLACGTAAVCFDVGGCGDAVKHSETGYLAKPNNLDDFVQGIMLLLSEPKKTEEMGKKDREMILANFTMKRQKEKYLELINQIKKT